MKKVHQKKLNPKLEALALKIREFLAEEGLDEFEIKKIKFEHQDSMNLGACEGQMCLVPVNGGLEWRCCPPGTC